MRSLYYGGGYDSDFAYVLVVAVLATFQHIAFGIRVGLARRRFGVQPPTMYAVAGHRSSASDGLLELTEEQADEFNRIQRIHQNNVEVLPMFYILLLLAGLAYPILAAASGLVWLLGRAAFAYGYGKSAEARRWGGFFHLGELGLIVLVLAWAGRLWKDSN
eukprot:TRINITY_DN15463_c0_g1_i1.p1 TRINITY_DN15463_c0_g1~~TRINITY_DN15463_c0_g1_i1.p1  ORF type:complete len:161 (-),score=39.78 TRINITY_DN15463_c0_g1_i1:148-630(-)